MNSLFFLIGFVGVIECYVSHALLGNYSEILSGYNICGKSRHWFETANHCFKEHPLFSDALVSGREALKGEAPWVVHVDVDTVIPLNCTGSLIAHRWVLTAAHCVDGSSIWLGIEFLQGLKFYVMEKHIIPYHALDVALLKLERPVPIRMSSDGEYFESNIICLPPVGLRPGNVPDDDREMVFISGWGSGHNNILQVGTGLLKPGLFQIIPSGPKIAIQMEFNGNGWPCLGDAGGPIYQYYQGRAVQIGMFLERVGGDSDCKNSNYTVAIYVPFAMDWIIQTILTSG